MNKKNLAPNTNIASPATLTLLETVTLLDGRRAPGRWPCREDDMTWPEVVAALRGLCEHEADDKTALPAWGPYRLHKRKPRANENVDRVSLLVLDVDRCNLDSLDAAINKRKVAAFLYASPSDDATQPDDRRVRVVAPLTHPIAPSECADTRKRFAEWLGLEPGCGVEGALDPSRVFFAGRLAGTPARDVRPYEGKPIDPEKLPASESGWKPAKQNAALAPLSALPASPAGIVEALGDPRDHKGWKWHMLGHVGGLMRQAGMRQAQCAAVVRQWLADTDADISVALERACGAWRHSPETVSGVDALAEWIGEEHAALVARTVTIAAAWPGLRERLKAHFARETSTTLAPANDADDWCGLGEPMDLAEACKEPDWLCKDLALAPGKMSMLTAYAGGGKTPFAALIAICVAAGVPLLGHEVRRARVVYLAFEGVRNATRKLMRIAKGLKLNLKQLQADGSLEILNAAAFDITTAAARVGAAIERHRLGLIVIDTVTSSLRGSTAGRNDEAYARVLWDIGPVAEQAGCVLLGLAHDSKSATGADLRGTSGSSAIVEAAQTVIRLEQSGDDHTSIRVSCARAPDDRFEPFGVRWLDGTVAMPSVERGPDVPLLCELQDAVPAIGKRGGNLSSTNEQNSERKRTEMFQAARCMIDHLRTGEVGQRADLVAASGDVSKRAANEALRRLVERGAVQKMGSNRYVLVARWRTAPPNEGDLQALLTTDAERVGVGSPRL